MSSTSSGGACLATRLSRVVLRKLSKEVSECYRLAQQAREWAEQATDPSIRQDLLTVEHSWLLLARSREFSERLTRFIGHRSRNRK